MSRKRCFTPEELREQQRALRQAEKNLRMRESAQKRKRSKSIFDEIEKDREYCLDDWRTARRAPFFGKFPGDGVTAQ